MNFQKTGRVIRNIGVALIALMTFGCLNHGGEEVDAGGGGDGGSEQANWQPIFKADSQISLANYEGEITRRAKKQRVGTRVVYSESWGLKNGRISYQLINYEEEFPIATAEELLVKLFTEHEELSKFGLALDATKIETSTIDAGPLAIAHTQNAQLQCMLFYLHSKISEIGAKKGLLEAASGQYCDAVSVSKDKFNAAAMAHIGNIRFDRGNLERDQSFSNLFGSLGKLEERDNLLDGEEVDQETVRPRVVVTGRLETQEKQVRLSGYISSPNPLTRVELDGKTLELDENAQFTISLSVDVGETELVFEAEDENGGVGRRVTTIIRYPESANFLPKERLGTYHALIIGINDYPDWLGQYVSDSGDADLANAISDAEQLAAVLDQEYGYEVRMLRDATVEQIIESLTYYRDNLTAEDNLLIFYAGHGIVVGDIGYWMPSDVERGKEETLISNRLLSRTLSQFDVGKVMLIADACYSASFVNQTRKVDTENFNRFDNQHAIVRAAMSSGGLEVVSDGVGQSPFNEALVNGLRRNDGIVSAQQLFVIVKSLTVRKAQQTPQYGAVPASGHQEGGDFLFVKETPFIARPEAQVSG